MNWKVKALLQKILSKSRLGDRINHLHGSLKKNYYPDGVEYGVNELFLKLDHIADSEFHPHNALEIGTGYFLVQPIVLNLLGWKRIVTVDITRDVFDSALNEQKELLLHDKYLSKIKSRSSLQTEDFTRLINELRAVHSLDSILKLCDITYIAPYSFEDVDRLGITFDFIFSQVVLEHIPPPVLHELFFYTKKWLAMDGRIVHVVNFTDHFANPGFFGDDAISEFNFLQYSNKFWDRWAGNQIAYTNRLGYPYYYQLCQDNNLVVTRFIEQNYKKYTPIPAEYIHPDVISNYPKTINPEELIKVQRGVFVIGHK